MKSPGSGWTHRTGDCGRVRAVALATMLLALPLAACTRIGAPPPTPEPTDVVLVAAMALPTETATLPPTPSPPPPTPDAFATLVAEATVRALPVAGAPGSVLGGPAVASPPPGCAIPRQPELWDLAPAADAPADIHEAWAGQAQSSLALVLVGHDPEGRRYTLRTVEADQPLIYELTYTGESLPLAPDQVYRVTYWRDPPGQPPAGTGLIIEDDAGPVFLGLSLRETEAADARVLEGNRAGFGIAQLPTQCLFTQVTPCGVELRAAPIEVARGAGRVALGPGTTAELPSDPPYQVRVATSHLRRPVADVPCPEPTDWVLSYAISRANRESEAGKP